jgi:hypothetical protein
MRGLIGLIGIGCAYMLARSVVAVRRGEVRISRTYGWLLRTALCLLAVWYPMRGAIDTADLAIWTLAAAAFAVGWWDASRVKKQEDLTHEIFPDSEEDPGNSAPRAS